MNCRYTPRLATIQTMTPCMKCFLLRLTYLLYTSGGVIAKVEEDGFIPNGAMAAISMRAKLRGLVDANGQPIFKTDMPVSYTHLMDTRITTYLAGGAR